MNKYTIIKFFVDNGNNSHQAFVRAAAYKNRQSCFTCEAECLCTALSLSLYLYVHLHLHLCLYISPTLFLSISLCPSLLASLAPPLSEREREEESGRDEHYKGPCRERERETERVPMGWSSILIYLYAHLCFYLYLCLHLRETERDGHCKGICIYSIFMYIYIYILY